MKARVVLVATAALTAVLPGIGDARADDPPRVCTVPADPAGHFLILYGSTPAVPAAPIGDSMTVVRFPAANTLQYMVVGSGDWHDVTYTYSSPEPGVAVLDSVQGRDSFRYELTLRCRTNDTGDYTYTAPGAAIASSDNTAVYRFGVTH